MATGDTKGNLLNKAFSVLRISGITTDPSPEDLELALAKLENMAAEFSGRNMHTNYAFEDEPDPNCPHNLDRKFWHSFEVNLAARLMPDYGRGVNPDIALLRQASAGISFLASATALVKQVQYPNRMPVGSGVSISSRWKRFYQKEAEAPNSYLTKTMYIGDVNDFVESFASYLKADEDIFSYTIETETGLTINSDSFTTQNILYNITATEGSSNASINLLKVKIIITTSDDRVETRIINFRLLGSEIND